MRKRTIFLVATIKHKVIAGSQVVNALTIFNLWLFFNNFWFALCLRAKATYFKNISCKHLTVLRLNCKVNRHWLRIGYLSLLTPPWFYNLDTQDFTILFKQNLKVIFIPQLWKVLNNNLVFRNFLFALFFCGLRFFFLRNWLFQYLSFRLFFYCIRSFHNSSRVLFAIEWLNGNIGIEAVAKLSNAAFSIFLSGTENFKCNKFALDFKHLQQLFNVFVSQIGRQIPYKNNAFFDVGVSLHLINKL